MKLSDYVINFFAERGINRIFGIAGGASLHLLNSIDENKDVSLVCNHHEQHSSMAADAYSRATNNFGVVVATSGPGATNLLTGVCGAYYDSVPLFCITGQVSTWRQIGTTGVRQIGFQETPVVGMYQEITKYCVQLDKPEKNIRFELEKAYHFMQQGRPGPVLLDIPDNFQREVLDISLLKPFVADPIEIEQNISYVNELVTKFNASKRPVIILGAGAVKASLDGRLKLVLDAISCPVVTTWGACDLLSHQEKYNFGNFGTHGNRLSNLVVQNSDFVLSIGARLDTKATGTPVNTFARASFKVMVDIDSNELNKFPHFNADIDLKICEDSGVFIDVISEQLGCIQKVDEKWFNQISDWENRLVPVDQEFRKEANSINVYSFFDKICKIINPNSGIVSDTGCALAWLMQTFKFEKGQKFFHDYNNTAMGWSLPAVTGIFHTGQFKQINCFVGDGSFMMSIQELAVIKHFNIPVNIFLINNSGYSMIKQTQDQWLGGKYAGSDSYKDLSFPDFASIATSFGFEYEKIDTRHDTLELLTSSFLNRLAPKLIEVIVGSDARVIPQVKYGRPNEDMEPLLSSVLFSDLMLIPSIREPE